MERLVKFPKGGNAWNADHVTAVYQVRSGAVRCGVLDVAMLEFSPKKDTALIRTSSTHHSISVTLNQVLLTRVVFTRFWFVFEHVHVCITRSCSCR